MQGQRLQPTRSRAGLYPARARDRLVAACAGAGERLAAAATTIPPVPSPAYPIAQTEAGIPPAAPSHLSDQMPATRTA